MYTSYSVLLTFLSILVPLGSLFFVGLPLATVLLPQKSWVTAPFLGLALIVLLLQSLLYLGVPIAYSFYLVWIAAAASWFAFIKTRAVKNCFPIPVLLLTLALMVYLLHSLGLIVVGPEYYVGRGWYDQFNYVITSQFLMEHSLKNINVIDYLYHPDAMKAYLFTVTDRIGENIFEGFIASSLFVDAKTSFEPVILMLPFFIVLVIYEIAMRFSLSKKTALFVAVISAGLPSAAVIHLESFLSQALVLPILLLWPCVMDDVYKKGYTRQIVAASLLLAVTASIYVEYYVIFIVTMNVIALMYCIRDKSIKPFVIMFIINVIALCLNISFLVHLYEVAVRALHGRNWKNIYPWVNSLNAIHWLWLGDFTWGLLGLRKIFFDVLTPVLLLLSYLGFVCVAYQKRDGISFAFLALIFMPVCIFLMNTQHYGYQFYKMLISVSPLFPVGIALALKYGTKTKLHHQEIAYYIASVFGFITISATLFMILVSINASTLEYVKRGTGYQLLKADTREVQDKLKTIHGKNIVIDWHDSYRHGDYMNGWLSYFARNNSVWLVNSYMGDLNLKGCLASVRTLPREYLLLTAVGSLLPVGAKKVWGNKTYELWEM